MDGKDYIIGGLGSVVVILSIEYLHLRHNLKYVYERLEVSDELLEKAVQSLYDDVFDQITEDYDEEED
jgi:hypothetical protein